MELCKTSSYLFILSLSLFYLWYQAGQYEFMLHFGVIYQITEPLLQQHDYIVLDVICSFTSSNITKFHFYE